MCTPELSSSPRREPRTCPTGLQNWAQLWGEHSHPVFAWGGPKDRLGLMGTPGHHGLPLGWEGRELWEGQEEDEAGTTGWEALERGWQEEKS